MRNQVKEYTQEQIKDTEKVCQILQSVPKSQRRLFVTIMNAYADGFETGIAMGRDSTQE